MEEHIAYVNEGLSYKVSVSRTTRGAISWVCTAEGVEMSMGAILELSDTLVAELQKRYPVQVEAILGAKLKEVRP